METSAESSAEEDARSDERINSALQTSSNQIKNPELIQVQQFDQSSSSNLDPSSLDRQSHMPHTVSELNVSDNCSTPDKFLNLFGTEMEDIDKVSGVVEIGDEVTVTAVSSSSPLTFHNFTDHSYFSSPRLATPPSSSIRFSDCQDGDSISISDPGLQLPLPEFHIHDLFDLGSEYQAFDNFLRYHDNNIDLQEQIIDSGQSTRDSESFQNQSQSHHECQFSWMFPCDIPGPGGDSYDCDNENENTNEENSDSSSEEEMMEDTDSEKNPGENLTKSYGNERKDHNNSHEERKEKRTTATPSHHHTGPFPHTFISVPGDRRSRFCFGLQTIVTKIRALMSRTGATANFKAEFENHTFTLENVDKLVKLSNRSQSQKSAGRKSKKVTTGTGTDKISDPPSPCGNSNQSEGAGAGADDDHRYAATILTQTESSSTVRDHQYNEVSTTNCEGDKRTSSCTEKSYIRTRYARERWLRKVATTIYSKMQRLINRTGAKMTLLIEYEGHLVTPKNYKELEHLLGTHRPALKKFNTKIVIQNHSQGHSQGSSSSLLCGMRENEFLPRVNNASEAEIVNVSSTHGKGASASSTTGHGEQQQDTLMKMRVSFPRSKKALNQSLQIEFLDTSRSSPSCLSAAPVLSNCFSGTGIRGSGSGSFVENALRPIMTTTTIEAEHDYDSQHGVDHSHNFHSDFFDESPVPAPSVSTSIQDASSRSTRGYTNAISGSDTSGSSSVPIPYEAPARTSNIPNTNTTMSCSSTFEPILEMTPTGPPPPAPAVVTSTSAVSTLFCDRNLGVSNNDENGPLNRLVEPSRVTMKRSVDAYTITDPRCELCGSGSQTSLAGSGAGQILSSKNKFPLWIRCANPLCQYLVHPSCIGFFVINAQQLQLLPPFFCPGHRDSS